jgi:protease I
MDVSDTKVAIVVHNYFEQAEFTQPLQSLKDAGAEVHVISASGEKEVQGLNHVEMADKFQADFLLDEADLAAYDALVLPGGAINADHLRMVPKVRTWVQEYMSDSRPVAAICHAPWVLVSAGVANGKNLTSFFTIQDDMKNAGAVWVDEEVVIDGNLITSRNPDDLPAFCSAIIGALQT